MAITRYRGEQPPTVDNINWSRDLASEGGRRVWETLVSLGICQIIPLFRSTYLTPVFGASRRLRNRHTAGKRVRRNT